MPHDKKGRLVEVGDHLKFEVSEYDGDGWNKRATIGRAMTVTPGTERCNVMAVHLVPGYFPAQQACITAKETELVLKADGSEPGLGDCEPAASEAAKKEIA